LPVLLLFRRNPSWLTFSVIDWTAMRILIAPDKFKGSLSAHEAAEAIRAGVETAVGVSVDLCPVADGGEGFAEALAARFDELDGILDPLGRPVRARFGWLEDGGAVVGMSEASGYHRLRPEERNPWLASTFGTGQLMRHAIERGAARIVVGLGGSATNDAGVGMAAALGWNFLTSDGEPLDPRPSNFLAIERIEAPEDVAWPPIIAASDVRNPLLGPEGSSHVFARQKGADDRMISHLEMALEHLADLVAEQVGVDYRTRPGAGAAGGLGYGLATFCNAEIQPGFPIVASTLHMEERIAASDLVITGEGRLDSQSLFGKAPIRIAEMARRHGKPVAMLCGQCEPGGDAAAAFDFIFSLEGLGPSPALCIANAAALLKEAAARAARHFLQAS
jgi:glycerate 2-kinase